MQFTDFANRSKREIDYWQLYYKWDGMKLRVYHDFIPFYSGSGSGFFPWQRNLIDHYWCKKCGMHIEESQFHYIDDTKEREEYLYRCMQLKLPCFCNYL